MSGGCPPPPLKNWGNFHQESEGTFPPLKKSRENVNPVHNITDFEILLNPVHNITDFEILLNPGGEVDSKFPLTENPPFSGKFNSPLFYIFMHINNLIYYLDNRKKAKYESQERIFHDNS